VIAPADDRKLVQSVKMDTQQLATSSNFTLLAYIGTAGLMLLVLVAGRDGRSKK